jgi:uncharacterized membrane protein HdeD (DUF308 family)
MDAVTRFDPRRDTRRLGWWLGIGGLLTVAFGVAALARPRAGIAMLVALFGVYAIAYGLAAVAAAIRGRLSGVGRAMLAIGGIASVAAGVLAFAYPGDAAVAVLFIVALRAIVVGAVEVVAAIAAGDELPNPWMTALAGAVSIVFGVLLGRHPSSGLLAMTWLVGVYALVVGTFEIGAALRVHTALHRWPAEHGA